MGGDLLCVLTFIMVLRVKNMAASASPLVNISDGQVIGFTQDVNGTAVDTFLGIPFAKPPVGSLRFRRPEPMESWEGVFNASTQPYTCKQHDSIFSGEEPQSEDCLYLNVWSPSTGGPLKTVMVWIHGGGFVSGTISHYDGKFLAAEQDVVVVAMQYRLGGPGFLYLGTEEAPGNMGLMDQQDALKWVQANIVHFGGDPRSVTIFGESAGSISVGCHLLAPDSQPLFKYSIMQSGGPFNFFLEPKPALDRSLALVKELGCENSNMGAIIQCLEPFDPIQMYNVIAAMDPLFPVLPLTVDGVLLRDTPTKLLEDNKHKRTNLLIGSTADEGSLFLWIAAPTIFTIDRPPALTREMFLLLSGISTDNITRLAAEFEYTVQSGYPVANYAKLASDIVGDRLMVCPTVKYAKSYAAKGEKVFKYQLAHRPTNHYLPEWFGVSHTADIPYVFGDPIGPFTPEERGLSQRIQTYWASFAKTGVPDDGEWNTWPRYEAPSYPTNILDLNPGHVTYRLNIRKCLFWEEYLSNLHQLLNNIPSQPSAGTRSEVMTFST